MNNSARATLYQVNDYLIHNLFLSYRMNDKVALQVNVKNLTDELYFTGVRNGATTNVQWARVGEGRSAIGTVTFVSENRNTIFEGRRPWGSPPLFLFRHVRCR
jgi:catecholate siderophore receptor